MKNYFLILFLALLSIVMKGQSDTAFISLRPVEFREEMKIVKPLLIDVRETFEYKKSRIPGAVNIPSQDDLMVLSDTINPATHIFVYCTTGYRSSKAAKSLKNGGFLHVYNLEGGIMGWKKAGFPVERRKKKNS